MIIMRQYRSGIKTRPIVERMAEEAVDAAQPSLEDGAVVFPGDAIPVGPEGSVRLGPGVRVDGETVMARRCSWHRAAAFTGASPFFLAGSRHQMRPPSPPGPGRVGGQHTEEGARVPWPSRADEGLARESLTASFANFRVAGYRRGRGTGDWHPRRQARRELRHQHWHGEPSHVRGFWHDRLGLPWLFDGPAFPTRLSSLAFEGATKRNRPMLKARSKRCSLMVQGCTLTAHSMVCPQ